MSDLKSVLTNHLPSPDVELGGRRASLNAEQLRKDLQGVGNKNRFVFYLGVVMLVVLFVAALILVWLWRDQPQLITGVFAATGLSTTGLVATMFSHWKEKVRVDMLLTLLASTDEETIKTVIAALVSKL